MRDLDDLSPEEPSLGDSTLLVIDSGLLSFEEPGFEERLCSGVNPPTRRSNTAPMELFRGLTTLLFPFDGVFKRTPAALVVFVPID